jgi:hypothetical protein
LAARKENVAPYYIIFILFIITDGLSDGKVCRFTFSSVLLLHGVSDVREAEIHTAEPPVPEPSVLEVELAIEKLNVTNH